MHVYSLAWPGRSVLTEGCSKVGNTAWKHEWPNSCSCSGTACIKAARNHASRPQRGKARRPAASEAKHTKAALPGTVLSQAAFLGWDRGKRASTYHPQLVGTVLYRGTWARSHSRDMFIPQWSTSL